MKQGACHMIVKDITLDYFPLKLAKGEQFCNRILERKTLKRNIELARHTVLVSPRRYGKSSLVYKVASEMTIPFECIDLFLAHDDKTVIKRILQGIGNIISQIVPLSHKTIASVQKYFSKFKVTLGANNFGLELSHNIASNDPVDQIYDALKSLSLLALERKKKVILFIDEFQDITNAQSAKSIQGAMRHVAQDTSSIVFIFSGSSRHLLLDMFDDSNKPLYMLCDKILLDRISSIDYHPHIQKAFKSKWGKTVDEFVLNRVLSLTECHPFYVNLLCSQLWKNHKLPTIDDVISAWLACFELEERRLIAEIEKLTDNQQDLLKALTVNIVNEPTSQAFLSTLGMASSSVRLGIKYLLENDMVYIVKNEDPNLPAIKKGQYKVLDPLLAYFMRKYE